MTTFIFKTFPFLFFKYSKFFVKKREVPALFLDKQKQHHDDAVLKTFFEN